MLKNVSKGMLPIETKEGTVILAPEETIDKKIVVSAQDLIAMEFLAPVEKKATVEVKQEQQAEILEKCQPCHADGKEPSEEDCKKCKAEEPKKAKAKSSKK